MGLFVLGLLVLVAVAVGYPVWHRRDRGADMPAVVVGWAARLISVDRAEWGRAMLGELGQYQGLARVRFALGCVVAALGLPRRDRSGRWLLASVLVASVTSAGLVGYGFVRYPGMVTGAGTWLALAAFAAVLAGFVVAAGVTTRQPRVGVLGLVSGGAGGGVWIAAATSLGSAASIPLLCTLPLAPIVVGIVAARGGRGRAAGRRVALVSAVVATLAVFLVLAGDTVLTGGRPYDAGQLRDFAGSGYPDLATYAVSDDLGTEMVLLLLMAAVTGLFGFLGTTLGARRA